MLSFLLLTFGTFYLLQNTLAYNYDPAWTQYNLNTNRDAQHPLEYSGEWEGHEYTASPRNWRFPFYTLFLDRFVNGDPTNDNINGTLFEHDLTSNQMRNGGDLQGFIDSLDYLEGMGIKVCMPNKSQTLLTATGNLYCWFTFPKPAMDLRLVFTTRSYNPRLAFWGYREVEGSCDRRPRTWHVYYSRQYICYIR